MTELIRSWLLGITFAAMALAITEQLTPEGSVKRVCRLAGGLVMILVAISPVMKADGLVMSALTRYEADVGQFESELTRQQEILYESIIAERAEAYISDKAKELGITCRVKVTVAWNDGIPQLHTVVLYGIWEQAQMELLGEVIDTELGIPRSLQFYEENGP